MAEAPSNNATLPSPGYDTSGVRVGVILWSVAGLVLSVALLLGILWLSQSHWLGEERSADLAGPANAPALQQPLQPSPGHPLLPWQDMAALRASQLKELQQGGPDPQHPTQTYLSIERAIDDLIRNGTLNQPWQNPTTYPFQRPPTETPRLPSVENRT